MRKLFVPGYGASGHHYVRGLSPGWRALEPPTFRTTSGSFPAYVHWLQSELRRDDETVWLAGHSMGGALAVAAAAAQPARVARLTLISPAGLPLRKPISASLARFCKQVVLGRYDVHAVLRDAHQALSAPRAALRLAQTLRRLDLSGQMQRLSRRSVPVEVVGCSSDTLVTPGHCRAAAELLHAEYRELDLPGGHMWMLDAWPQLAELLSDPIPASGSFRRALRRRPRMGTGHHLLK